AYDEVDSYCSPKKQYLLLKVFVEFYQEALKALRSGVGLDTIRAMPIIPKLLRAKFEIPNEEVDKLNTLREEMLNEFQKLSGLEVKPIV
ncbi:MAG: V-type ATP synthase subunit A, partial [Nitrososphaerales archaeon]